MDLPPISPCSKVTSLPQTLEQLLSDTNTDFFHDYQHYLEQSFCCENLQFWLDVQKYQHVCGPLGHDGGSDYLQQDSSIEAVDQALFHVVQRQCHVMIDTYIRPNSIQEINIPCEMRQELLDQVFCVGNYHPRIFTRSVKSILELMRVNAFIPWLASYMTTTSSIQQQQQHLSSSPSSSLSSTGHSFVIDRWHPFSNNNNKIKSVCRSASMDSTLSWDIMENGQLDMSVTSPPPSPIASSSPTKYCKSMLQRVKHSFMPPSSTIKSSVSWKHQ